MACVVKYTQYVALINTTSFFSLCSLVYIIPFGRFSSMGVKLLIQGYRKMEIGLL